MRLATRPLSPRPGCAEAGTCYKVHAASGKSPGSLRRVSTAAGVQGNPGLCRAQITTRCPTPSCLGASRSEEAGMHRGFL